MIRKKEHRGNNNGKNHTENESESDFPLVTEPDQMSDSDMFMETTPEMEAKIADEETMNPEVKAVQIENLLAQMNDKYLRLSAEFDNYRKRTLREKMELTRTASESVMQSILPVVDDFDRAIKSIEQGMDFEATKEGILLIYNKFKDFAKQNGIKEIDAAGNVFNTDLHEAITKVPAPSDELKGKIIDVIQKGYYLNDKVIRFAKVVVGE